MRWLTFLVFALLILGVETGLSPLAAVPGPGGVTPQLSLVLVAFVAVSAPPTAAAWAGLVLGLAVDLLHPVTTAGDGMVVVVGPAALGYLVGAVAVARMRTALFRRAPWTHLLMTLLAGVLAHAVAWTLLTARALGWLPAEALTGWAPTEQLLRRLASVGYAAAAALVLGPLLVRTDPMWAFAGSRLEDRSHRRR